MKSFSACLIKDFCHPSEPYMVNTAVAFLWKVEENINATVIPKSHPTLLFTSLQTRSIDTEMLAWLCFLLVGFHSPGHVPSVRWSSYGLL